jgi:hypothetical protein
MYQDIRKIEEWDRIQEEENEPKPIEAKVRTRCAREWLAWLLDNYRSAYNLLRMTKTAGAFSMSRLEQMAREIDKIAEEMDDELTERYERENPRPASGDFKENVQYNTMRGLYVGRAIAERLAEAYYRTEEHEEMERKMDGGGSGGNANADKAEIAANRK